MKRTLLTAIAAFGIAGTAFAVPTSDLVLGFRDDGSAGGSGTTTNVEIDLGSVLTFKDTSAFAPGSTVFTGINLTNLGANSLNTVYGSSWSTDTGLFWGVVGSSGNTTTTRTLWVTSNATGSLLDGNASSIAWQAKTATTQSSAASKIATVYNGFASGSASLATTVAQSWSANEGATNQPAAFVQFNPRTQFENSFGSLPSASDLYELAPANAGNSGVFLGTFSIASNGDLNFTAAGAAAVPEPSTYALILGAATLGFVALRRRNQKQLIEA